MSNLLTSLASSANALRVFERALVVSQNNVANASTQGYAKQRLSLEAAQFDPAVGLIGGLRAGEVLTARDQYAEQAVRRQLESLGYHSQMAESLAAIESVFDVTGDQGIVGALNELFTSFSAWSLEPDSNTARQAVLEKAQSLAQSFAQASTSLERAFVDTGRQIRETVERVNQIGAELREYNTALRQGGQDDAGLDTKVQNALEELSELVSFTTLRQEDGSVTVLLGGQTPLLIGEHLYSLRISFDTPSDPPPDYPGAAAPARLLGGDGQEITQQISGGRLAGLIDVRNTVLPSLAGDAYHVGDLNVLAKSVADRINQILAAGNVSDGPPPVAGAPLFTYDATNDARAAATFALDPGITAAKLAAISPGPPYVSNGAALQLASLASPQDEADRIDGFSYVEYYGRIAGNVGRLLTDAENAKDFKTQMVTQARSLRTELSGVSLDEEAIRIVEFQRAYQANAKMISVLSDLTEIALGLLG
ncbi:MAG: flagellar hook-associated protein FlgK [Bryobacteraceae bacterium]